MNRFFVLLLKGVVGLIWLLATIITSLFLSPFILVSWISKIIGKKKTEVAEDQVKEVKSQKVSEYNY